MSAAEEEDVKPRIAEDAAGSANQEEEGVTPGQEEVDENLKIISKKALADYKRAEELFMEFLATADVWSSEEVSSTIIDFHLVEKCRTKFRAFVRSHGAKVKFDPVDSAARKQEYHGTVTVSRACKQQYLTQKSEIVRPGKTPATVIDGEAPRKDNKPVLQCAAPTPITTGGKHIPYTPDDIYDTPCTLSRLPSALRDYLSPRHGNPLHPSPRDTTTGAPPIRTVKQEPQGPEADISFASALARNTAGAGLSNPEARQDLKAWMDPLSQAGGDLPEQQLGRSSTFPANSGLPRTLSSQTLRRKRFSLQDDYSGIPLGAALLPDAGTLLGRRHDASISLCGDGSLLESQRRTSCGLMSPAQGDGMASQAKLARRRTSAPSNARRSDVFTGMSAELALAAQRFLNSTSEYPEGAGIEPQEPLPAHMFTPLPSAVGASRNPCTDASPRKSPRIVFDPAAMRSQQLSGGMQPPQDRQRQPPLPIAAQMMYSENAGKREDLPGQHSLHSQLLSGAAPLDITPLSAPLDSNSAALPLARVSHISAPLPGLSTSPQMQGHPGAVMDSHQPGPDSDMEGLWQLLAPEAAPQQQHFTSGGNTPNTMTQHCPPDELAGLQPSGMLHQGSSSRPSPSSATPQHPASAGHAHAHHSGRNIGEAYAAVEGLATASFSVRSTSSAAASLADVVSPGDHLKNTIPGQAAAGMDLLGSGLKLRSSSECNADALQPSGFAPLHRPCSPPFMLFNNAKEDVSWACSGPLKQADPARDMLFQPCGMHGVEGLRQRRQSSSATMQAPIDELHTESEMHRLVVRASDTSGGSTEMPPCGFPMEPDMWAHDLARLRGPLYRARRTSM